MSADVLYDQLGVDVEARLEADHVGELSALVVYHMLTGEKRVTLHYTHAHSHRWDTGYNTLYTCSHVRHGLHYTIHMFTVHTFYT